MVSPLTLAYKTKVIFEVQYVHIPLLTVQEIHPPQKEFKFDKSHRPIDALGGAGGVGGDHFPTSANRHFPPFHATLDPKASQRRHSTQFIRNTCMLYSEIL